ncbi:LacI family transcriptional regulator [Occultella glacieicola]|uniref:LacI family transcriptional regulator n=1 Tax=Occultella glacieicola TaxID=2518684 RepID=A0ABY2E1T0_9MICO|nr:LacI family DNA-binding transcriptional regulator [Occultella glacieicola]TDE91530.1 LacI family transcriptional regulator [Occultella glacieicola]
MSEDRTGEVATVRSARRPTVKDVAAAADVSWKTVSNVVNGTAPVRASTRERVQRAIDQLGYRPNAAGRNLRRGRSRLLALAIPEIRLAYFADLAHAVILAAKARGYTVLIDETFADPAHERVVAQGFQVDLLDGLIFSPQALSDRDLVAAGGRLPMVMLGEATLPLDGGEAAADHVVIDNVASAREATEHLIEAGRSRIGFLGVRETETNGTGVLRHTGYAMALQEHGLPAVAFPAPTYSRPGGAAAIGAVIERFTGPDALDALVCANDLLAIGAMHILRGAGLRVPQDVAVIGWDGTEDGNYSNPTLTTVAPDLGALAELAVDLALGRVDGSTASPQVHLVGHRLIVRESTGGALGG